MPTTTENRQAQYLRILTEGPQKTLSDAEVAQWLIDKGYAKGHVRDLSHLRHPTDADVKIIWQGITHEGRIFIEWLRSQLEQSKQKPADRPANHHSQAIKPTVQSVVSQVPPVEHKL